MADSRIDVVRTQRRRGWRRTMQRNQMGGGDSGDAMFRVRRSNALHFGRCVVLHGQLTGRAPHTGRSTFAFLCVVEGAAAGTHHMRQHTSVFVSLSVCMYMRSVRAGRPTDTDRCVRALARRLGWLAGLLCRHELFLDRMGKRAAFANIYICV